MNKIIFRQKHYLIPASLQEISTETYIKCLPSLLRWEADTNLLNRIELQVLCLEQLLDLNKNWALKVYLTSQMEKTKENTLQHSEILSLANFLFESKYKVYNVFKILKIKGKKYFSVADRLENMKVREFIFAENYLRSYLQSQSDKDLNLFMACLYRKADSNKNPKSHKFDGDIRVNFNENILEIEAEKFSKIHRNIKLSALNFFVESMNLFKTDYPLIFSENGNKGSDSWLDVIVNLCEKVTEIPAYTDTNLHDFLLFINKKTQKQ